MKTGLQRFEEERRRQIEEKGYTPDHDAQYVKGELHEAALCYFIVGLRVLYSGIRAGTPQSWPFAPIYWRPSPDPLRNFEKAGALHLADADRLERAGDAHKAAAAKNCAHILAGLMDCIIQFGQKSE